MLTFNRAKKCSGHFSYIFTVVTNAATNSGIPTLCDNLSKNKWNERRADTFTPFKGNIEAIHCRVICTWILLYILAHYKVTEIKFQWMLTVQPPWLSMANRTYIPIIKYLRWKKCKLMNIMNNRLIIGTCIR